MIDVTTKRHKALKNDNDIILYSRYKPTVYNTKSTQGTNTVNLFFKNIKKHFCFPRNLKVKVC